MGQIRIPRDRVAVEKGVDHGVDNPFLLAINLETKTAVFHHKPQQPWIGGGLTSYVGPELRVVTFEDYEVNKVINSITLFGTKTVIQGCPVNRSKAEAKGINLTGE